MLNFSGFSTQLLKIASITARIIGSLKTIIFYRDTLLDRSLSLISTIEQFSFSDIYPFTSKLHIFNDNNNDKNIKCSVTLGIFCLFLKISLVCDGVGEGKSSFLSLLEDPSLGDIFSNIVTLIGPCLMLRHSTTAKCTFW